MALTTRESRLPELRLPEISREGISRGLSEMRGPDLSKLERPNLQMPDIDMPKIDLPKIDIGKAVNDAAIAVGLARPQRRRWPFVLGGAIVLGLTAWALMQSTAFRQWLDNMVGMARERMDPGEDIDDPVAFTAAETAPIDAGPYASNGEMDVAGAFDAAGASANDYPEGLGATADMMAGAEEGTPAFETAKKTR
jgi:hypothetical protein